MPITFLPFILLIVPIMEISVFVIIGGEIGALWTIALVLLTAILGSILLRIEGFRTFNRIREKMNSGQIPGEELAKGAMILVAGVLLLTPGFITDALGFALFLPFVRKIIWIFLANRFVVRDMSGFTHSNHNDRGNYNPEPGVVDLNPDDFRENPNDQSPWFADEDGKGRRKD